jgi:hypothetical protein
MQAVVPYCTSSGGGDHATLTVMAMTGWGSSGWSRRWKLAGNSNILVALNIAYSCAGSKSTGHTAP